MCVVYGSTCLNHGNTSSAASKLEGAGPLQSGGSGEAGRRQAAMRGLQKCRQGVVVAADRKGCDGWVPEGTPGYPRLCMPGWGPKLPETTPNLT